MPCNLPCDALASKRVLIGGVIGKVPSLGQQDHKTHKTPIEARNQEAKVKLNVEPADYNIYWTKKYRNSICFLVHKLG